MNSTGKAWMVCRQHYKRGERFHDEQEAMRYAELLAQRLGGERVEVFACTANLFAEIPVTTVKDSSHE